MLELAKEAWLWFMNTRLGRFLRRHFEPIRVLKSLAAALPLIVLGTWLLRYEVSQQHVDPALARLINIPPITLLSYLAARWVWRDRQTGFWHGLWLFFVASLVQIAISFSLYILLAKMAGLPYLYVSIGLIITLGPTFYVFNNVKIFAARQRQQKAAMA